MKKIKLIAMKPYLLIFFCVCLVVVLSSFKLGIFKASAYKKKINFPVKSLLPNLTIVDVKVQGSIVLLSFRNDYSKTITAFSVSSSGVITRNEMLDSEYEIIPGSINTGEYELPLPSRPEKGMTLLAAVFEDGTTDGDPEFIRQILDARAGEQAQLTRILSLLEETSIPLKKVDTKEKWQTLRLKIAQLSDCEKGKSFEFCAAFNDEKELALRKVKQLEQIQKDRGDEVAQSVLAHIRERYERNNIMIQLSLKQVR